VLPFWISIVLLSIAQGAVVALPGPLRVPALARLRRRGWALVPPLSVIVFVIVAGAAERASAQSLTYLALVAVPALAALALGALVRGGRPLKALAVPALFALAWLDRGALPGEAAALVLTALACVSLGVLIAAVTPPRWLAAGIVAMAVADTALVVSNQLQKPNSALNAAHPAAGLPRLQDVVFGSAVMGFGDVFVAGALGGLLAATVSRRTQLRTAALTAVLAVAFDGLFFFVDELPATVPVALALIVMALLRRRRAAGARVPAGPLRRRQARPHRARARAAP
jgi:hypothetical protein